MALCLTLNIVFEIIQPTVSLALTEGPSQPEVQSFEPINTTQMVDLFTGDFNYNIPLFNLPGPNGGYPVNLAYHAGVTMDDEASWVGLGWNVNVGSLVRNMRGLPDEFQSHTKSGTLDAIDDSYDYVEVQSDMKQSWTLGGRGGLHAEVVGADLQLANLSASIYYNNYTGMGASVGAGFEGGAGFSGGAYSLGLSLDTENGLGVSAGLSLKRGTECENRKHTLSVNFDGNLSVAYGIQAKGDAENKIGAIETQSSSYGSSMSFAGQHTFNPSFAQHINQYNLSIGITGGAEVFGFFSGFSMGLFYNTQDYAQADKNGRKHLVAGYDQAGSADITPYFLRDFNRSNDGQITRASMFLASSAYTYDTYNSTGQGLSGYFRPRRADIGRTFDPYLHNTTIGAGGSLEVGGGSTAKVGFDIDVNFGWNSQGPWEELNNLLLEFTDPAGDGVHENLYYQAHGEQTILDAHELDHIRGTELPFVRLKTKDADDLAGGKRRIDASATSSAPNHLYKQQRTPTERVVRNTLIHNLKNKEVGQLGEFMVKYFTSTAEIAGTPTHPLDRSTRRSIHIDDHPAGYKVLNEEGSCYVYGLPAYNLQETENLFSIERPASPSNPSEIEFYNTPVGPHPPTVPNYKVDGTDKFIRKTTKSPYAHSYLLTAVQGADYVDLSNDGPTDDDLGYWVKFNYLDHTAGGAYKWRSPYRNNQYHAGAIYTPKDDKASYQYGEKEMWYLGQIETKSHIAIFELINGRVDSREALAEYGADQSSTRRGLLLNTIKLYEKKAYYADPAHAVPLQTVHFDYDNEHPLCVGVPNANSNTDGKLTLKKVWFTSNGSERGKENPYEFTYAPETIPPGTAGYQNPNYAPNSYDSWGTYRPKGSSFEHSSHFPYTNQFNQDWDNTAWEPAYGNGSEDAAAKKLTQETNDALASAWCLKQIGLPSGGKINISYESDDYGYVQHKTANQMFKISKLGDHADLSNQEIYSGDINEDFYDEKKRRIYFKLEHPIPVSQTLDEASQQVYNDYVKPIIQDEAGQRNLFFKTKMRLTSEVYDYVSGYLPLEKIRTVISPGSTDYNFGVGETTAGGYYTQGYVTVQMAKRKNGDYFYEYHPMALAGWTYLQTNASKLLHNPNSLESEESYGNARDLLNKLADFLNIVPATASSFGAIRAYCKAKNMARYIDLNNSCIRLASPDKVKFGGGHRVKQIEITDNWGAATADAETSRQYGQVFSYTMQEDGKTISSGVAQYEPQAGGDENALKYPIYYFDKQTLFTNNNLFAEAPVNEQLFPGPSVGYRQVTVKSLHTNRQIRQVAGETDNGRTGGVTVHSFYTAKDFPTLVEWSLLSEENGTKDVFNMPILIPLVGSIQRHYYHGTQAYKIELNDMHGKPKSVESFELNGHAVNPAPISSSIYEYQSEQLSYQGETVNKLDNSVNIIANDGTYATSSSKRLMGVEYDLFTDQRESKSFSNEMGFQGNLDVPLVIPLPNFWLTYSNSKYMMRTYVTNKVIHRTGILKRTKTRDLQTVNESEIVAYDEKSGIPVLTTVKNEFGDDFYNYNIPAYYAYDRMGHAYRNINYSFETALVSSTGGTGRTRYIEFDGTAHLNNLVRGDELLVKDATGTFYYKAYFLGWKYVNTQLLGILDFAFTQPTPGSGYQLKVIRSGRRNNFGTPVASYVTKGKLPDLLLATSLQIDPADAQITTRVIGSNVLAATASLFKDDWTSGIQPNSIVADKSGVDAYQGTAKDLITENPFLSGNSGIWRPFKSYTYVGARSASGDLNGNSSPSLKNDGTMSNVPMFSWELGDLENYQPNWEWVNEVTRYSPDAYELENVNRLGILSSALYGYDNSLSIAVGSNAGYNELGTADFETIKGMDDYSKLLGQTNLNFDNSHAASTGILVSEIFHIQKATVLAGATGILRVYLKDDALPTGYTSNAANRKNYVHLTLTSRKNGAITGSLVNAGFFFNGLILNYQPKSGNSPGYFDIQPYLRRGITEKLVPNDGIYHGKIAFFFARPTVSQNATAVSYVSTKAHSGKKSMKIASGSVFFDQPKVKLLADMQADKPRKYILSLWVSRDDKSLVTFKPTSGSLVEIGKMSGSSFAPLTNAPVVTYSKIIEGWQKIDLEFQWDNGNDIPVIRFNSGTTALYADDIRVSPKTGGMMTYVYDPVKFWLKATLSADNYATFYHYDKSGNLRLQKQETESGIYTTNETRGHVSKNVE